MYCSFGHFPRDGPTSGTRRPDTLARIPPLPLRAELASKMVSASLSFEILLGKIAQHRLFSASYMTMKVILDTGTACGLDIVVYLIVMMGDDLVKSDVKRLQLWRSSELFYITGV